MTVATIQMFRAKECKYSVVYESTDPKAAVRSLYLMRSFAPVLPARLTITVADGRAENPLSETPIERMASTDEEHSS